MTKIHLSYDLDFHCQRWKDTQSWKLWQKLKSYKVPMKLYLEHHHILDDLNKTKYDEIVNIDFHDDLFTHQDTSDVCDYNWVNFYKYRHTCSYMWIYPKATCFSYKNGKKKQGRYGEGRCCEDVDIWIDKKPEFLSSDSYKWIVAHNYKYLLEYNDILDDILKNVVDISVIISPEYIFVPSVERILEDCHGDFIAKNFPYDRKYAWTR